MNASILTREQQQKTLSGLKNRKKTPRNILAAPDLVKISNPVLNETYIPKIITTLEDLLPNARLPQNRVPEKSKVANIPENGNKTSAEPSLKRRQLFLGINSVSRGINNETVSCILYADDVKPKLLISHLIVLCSLRNIPYLTVENLRDITKRTLGFSCIAIGFKKDSSFFTPIISLIKLAVEHKNVNLTTETSVDNTVTSIKENCEERSIFQKPNQLSTSTDNSLEKKVPFTYLYRNSNIKRAFVPDSNNIQYEKNDSMSFIAVEAEDEVNASFSNTFQSGKTFSSNKDMTQIKINDKIGNKKLNDLPIEYAATKIIKMEANPNRRKKKFVKMKKKL